MKKLLLVLLLLPCLLRGQSIVVSTDTNVVCSGAAVGFNATVTGVPSPHYRWMVNHVAEGADSSGFVTTSLLNNDTVACELTNAVGDTVLATSNSIVMTVQHIPNAGVIVGSDTVCIGSSITWTATVPGGAWATSNTNVSATSGIIKGLHILSFEYLDYPSYDTVYYLFSNNCGTDTSRKKVTVMPHPPDPSFYLGFSRLFVANQTNVTCLGVPLTAFNPNFNGQYPGRVFSTNGLFDYTAGDINPIHVGTDIIIGVTTNYCGHDTASVPINVVDSTIIVGSIVTSKDHLCPGDTLRIIDTGHSPLSIIWSTRYGNGIINPTSGLFNAITAGQEIVTFRLSNQCSNYKTVSKTITIDPPYPIDPINPICVGDEVTMSDSAIGGKWSTLGKYMSKIDSITGNLKALSSGFDTISYALVSGCSVSVSIKVNPNPAPIKGEKVVCSQSRIVLTDSTTGGQWSTLNNNLIVLDTRLGTVSCLAAGTSLIKYTLATGCYDSTYLYSTDCSKEINLFPDPAKNEVYIEADTLHYTDFIIVDISGRVMGSGKLSTVLTRIDTELWRPGMYIINIQGVNGLSYYGKLVKE